MASKALSAQSGMDMMCRVNPGVWAEERRGFVNADFQWEWYRFVARATRLALVAPREHAKTEIVTVNATAHRSIYVPGIWTYVFAATLDQAEKIKERVDQAVLQTEPHLFENARSLSTKETVYANGSRVTVAGAGKAVRGSHPDVIIGDDVLEEANCLTQYQRKKTSDWWFGTVANMAHPGAERTVGGVKVRMPPTRIFLVGTPFHKRDLLLSMRENPMYQYRRYAAEYAEGSLVDGLAVDAA